MSGEIEFRDLKQLWELIEGNAFINNIRLEMHEISYSTTVKLKTDFSKRCESYTSNFLLTSILQDRKFRVSLLQYNAVKLLRDLAELSGKDDSFSIVASLYQCTSDSEEQRRDFNELEKLAQACYLKVMA